MEARERWAEVKQLVHDALQRPPEEREALIDSALDTLLRSEAKSLLAVSEEKASLFDRVKVSSHFGVPILEEGDTVGGYTIDRLLDEGGSAAVYLATDTRNGRKAALKILSPQAPSRSFDEDRTLARLSHPSIATLYESGTTERDLRFVAMEYVEGIHIDRYCEDHRLGLNARLDLFEKVCDAVGYAHQNLVVHRDLKPKNILIKSDGTPKLLDFGIAKLLSDDLLESAVTLQGDRAFTLAFASPEQVSGEATAVATDVYSLGILLSLLLSCRLPYRKDHLPDLQRAIREVQAPKTSELVGNDNYPLWAMEHPPEGGGDKLRKLLQGDLDAIISKALRKEPAGRYASVRDLSEDLHRYLDLRPVGARRGNRRYRAAKFARRHWSSISITSLFFLLLALGGVRLFMERERARQEALRAEATSAFLLDMFKVSRSGRKNGHTITGYELADNAATRLHDALPLSPSIRGTLRSALGNLYGDLALTTPATNLLVTALTDLERAGAEKERLVPILFRLARFEYDGAYFRESERYLRRALDLDRGATISPREREGFLGKLCFARGDTSAAEGHFREELRLALENRVQDDYRVATAENDLAVVLHTKAELKDARALYEKSLRIRQKLYRADHPSIIQIKHNLARLLEDEGKVSEAQILYEEVWSLTASEGIYSLIGGLVMQSSGECLTTLGKYSEAAHSLYKGLTIRRRLLPDSHPDIARSLAGLARVAHAEERFGEAEPEYRESLRLLERLFGQDHPDRLSVESNLAALLAETGRREEAKALLEDAMTRTSKTAIRRIIPSVIRENLAHLRAGNGENGRYLTLATFALDVGEPGEEDVFKEREAVEITLGAAMRFKDDFQGSTIDPSKWEYGGRLVSQVPGELRIDRTVTDSGGWARTKPIRFDPTLPFAIRRWVEIHPGNEKFGASFEVEITGYPEKRFGVGYANFAESQYSHLLGFVLFRQDANPMSDVDRKTNTTTFFTPVFDRWFLEELLFDSRTGDLRYAIDGRERQVFNVGRLPPEAETMTLHFTTWGWWTGHYQHMKSLEVRQ
jgi:serine/threonine-protein kinase